jgi:DNA-binding Lrp family transcriptional regulator
MKNQVIRNNIQTATSSLHDPPAHKKRKNPLDELDIKIINLMAISYSNNEISEKLAVPLSTIQRRTRLLLAKGYVQIRGKIDYRKLGYRRGVFHVYLRGDGIREVAEKSFYSNITRFKRRT